MKKSKLDNTTIGPSLASTKSGHPHNSHDGVYETPTDACAGRRARPQLNAARGKIATHERLRDKKKNDDGLISRRIVTRLLINTPIAKERSSIFHRENIPFSALPPPNLSRIRSESVSLGSLLKKSRLDVRIVVPLSTPTESVAQNNTSSSSRRVKRPEKSLRK